MMMAACERGLGVALGRGGLCADELASGRLVRPFPQSRPADYAYYVVTPEGHGRGAAGAGVPGLAGGRGGQVAAGDRRAVSG